MTIMQLKKLLDEWESILGGRTKILITTRDKYGEIHVEALKGAMGLDPDLLLEGENVELK